MPISDELAEEMAKKMVMDFQGRKAFSMNKHNINNILGVKKDGAFRAEAVRALGNVLVQVAAYTGALSKYQAFKVDDKESMKKIVRKMMSTKGGLHKLLNEKFEGLPPPPPRTPPPEVEGFDYGDLDEDMLAELEMEVQQAAG
ncbi:unnamed protein product [Amoebophrya sp. A25]|nr:unnamed protein product [Amoebophrya sp. A25]|eukprot:GSA25T00007240001.1